ncbi:hsp70 nucleotide exchange factor fes1 [Castilleja foliolosa]|uniref:Hsp70 nucleotide exchange factor fes1 n=1 Tax=Castilleja foliolosa TaxID=1961234 RepID=A0ABD3BI56_9LAMI
MAASAAVVSSPLLNPLNHDNDDDSEYEEIEEEIEVEDEIEVEEEIDDEEEIEVEEEIEGEIEGEKEEEIVEAKDDIKGDEDEIGEELTPLREEEEENQVIDMDLEDPDEHIPTVVYVSNPPNDIPATQKDDVGHVKSFELSEKRELHVNGETSFTYGVLAGERTSREADPKAPLCGNGIASHAEDTPLVGDYGAASIMADASREKDNISVSAPLETNHATTEALADIRQMSPRFLRSLVPQVRFREPSSSAEFVRENKKLRIICEFHAKGWCIKGDSCRFLHIKDGLDAVVKKDEPLVRQASSSGCVLPQQSEAETLLLRKDDTLAATRLEDRVSFEHNLYLNNKYRYPSAPLANNSLIEKYSTQYNWNFSSCSASSREKAISPFRPTLDEMVSKKNDLDLPYSHSRQPLSFGSFSWNTDALGTQNLLKRRKISPAPCSESEILLQERILSDVNPDKSNQNKSSSDYWAPSSPFRPSHAIIRKMLMKENLYDPIHDSIEQQTEVKDGRLKFSHSDQGSSVKNVNVQSNSSAEEDKLLDSVHVGGITVKDINNKLSSSCDNKLKNVDEQRHKMVLRVDKNEDIDVGFKKDGQMQNELKKATKNFQSELIEFVKELVKPTWHEGLLSRDAHKMIVKKTVDKVISTMQPHQIPGTGETIKLYLSSSQPKLVKLVEAYIEKYGKI